MGPPTHPFQIEAEPSNHNEPPRRQERQGELRNGTDLSPVLVAVGVLTCHGTRRPAAQWKKPRASPTPPTYSQAPEIGRDPGWAAKSRPPRQARRLLPYFQTGSEKIEMRALPMTDNLLTKVLPDVVWQYSGSSTFLQRGSPPPPPWRLLPGYFLLQISQPNLDAARLFI